METWKRKYVILLIIVVCVLAVLQVTTEAKKIYQYKFYYYRKKPKVEKKFRAARLLCINSDECKGLEGLSLTNCWRVCMAAHCYDEIYAPDELEQGEIDVRSNSFKGCWLKSLPDMNRANL
ncbi:hypothetical protein HOLleu_15138 [Holothuria leucospilota]|uniref:Uncharacterized protein n=1 Tax=Holothuria leucospilota TaxID=206669 RepID=A0A9Q1C9N8_HOLLE|nr:hypothetical protein HOLleu_15138 [Holothuria leucospilota]